MVCFKLLAMGMLVMFVTRDEQFTISHVSLTEKERFWVASLFCHFFGASGFKLQVQDLSLNVEPLADAMCEETL